MLPQQHMIARVRERCHADPRIVAALMYGSFTKGEADVYSDIEFVIFIDDKDLLTFEPVTWLEQIAPVALYYVNEHGIGDVIFQDLTRGEFHFDPVSAMADVRTWGAEDGFPEPAAMLVLDRTGELIAHLAHISGPGPDRSDPGTIAWHWHSFLNWMLFGAGVLARGERARALEILGIAHRDLLRLARLVEATTRHWQTPSRNVEHDLSPKSYDRYVTCTAGLDGHALEQAYAATWTWGKELARALARTHGLDPHEPLLTSMGERFKQWGHA